MNHNYSDTNISVIILIISALFISVLLSHIQKKVMYFNLLVCNINWSSCLSIITTIFVVL